MLKRIVVINVNPKIYDNVFFKRIKSFKNAEIIGVKDNKSEILKHISTASALVNCSSKFFDKEVFLVAQAK